MTQVTVLMSTFNGEKFLDEQIESILKQKNIDVTLIVRDDGSADRTIEILEKWKRSGHVQYYIGENLGPKKSFLNLIKNVSEKTKYYAFADQDDIWELNKLEVAVQKLHTENTPSIFLSSYTVVNSELQMITKKNAIDDMPSTLQESLMFNRVLGCSMVFNKELLLELKAHMPSYTLMHDYWVMLVVMSLDVKIHTSNVSLFQYRQHSGNTIGSRGFSTRIKHLIKNTIMNKNERFRQVASVYDCFASNLDKVQLSDTRLIVQYRNSIRAKVKLLFNPRFKSKSKINNVLFKIAIVLGVY